MSRDKMYSSNTIYGIQDKEPECKIVEEWEMAYMHRWR